MISRRPTVPVLAILWVLAAGPTLCVGTPLAASDPLRALVDEALARNTALSASRLAERRAAAEHTAAITRWLPAVSLETRASRLHDVQDLGDFVNPAYAALNQLSGSNAFPSDLSLTLPRAYESHVRVTQPLVHESLRASVALAGAQRDAEHEAHHAAARRLAADVQVAWLDAASASRVVEIQESALELVRENERVAERLLAAGRVTPEAVHRARADRATVEQALADAHEQRLAATRELNRLAGRPLHAAPESLPDSVFESPMTLTADDVVRSALAGREELAQASAGARAARAGVRAASGTFLPRVSGAFDLAWQGDEWTLDRADRSWTASLVASWDLFRGGSDLALRTAARAEAERAGALARDASERVTVEVLAAHEAARVAYDAVATARTRAEAARRTYTLVHRRFQEGSATPLELTEARTQQTAAETNQALTLYRSAVRRVQLERAAALRDLPFTTKGARP